MAIEWDEVKAAAVALFDIWTSGGDLEFAKEAWGHLHAAGLCDDASLISRTKSVLRLLALRKFYGEFCAAKWQEGDGSEWLDRAGEIEDELPPLVLGVLAGPSLEPEAFGYDDEYELRCAVVTTIVEELEPAVVDCLKRACGGTSGLYARLSKTPLEADDEDEDDGNASENDPKGDFDPMGDNLAAYAVVENAGER